MFSQIMEYLLNWTKDSLGALGPLGLFILAIIESIFFPIPVEVLLIFLVVLKPSSWFILGIIALAGSIIGACIAYRIGYIGEELILKKLFPKQVKKVHAMIEKYGLATMFIAGFTPLPFKLFAIAAGAFYMRFIPFVIICTISRGSRFLLVAAFTAYLATRDIAFSWPLINSVTLLIVLLLATGWAGKMLWFRKSC